MEQQNKLVKLLLTPTPNGAADYRGMDIRRPDKRTIPLPRHSALLATIRRVKQQQP